MYYKIFDEETQSYVPSVYNAEDRKEIKVAMEWLLKGDLSYDDIKSICSLKWDQFVCKLNDLGYIVEQQVTPFEVESLESETAWNEFLENDFEEVDY